MAHHGRIHHALGVLAAPPALLGLRQRVAPGAAPTSWCTAGSGPATRPRPGPARVAVAGDTVRAVGDSASIAPLVGPATRVLANGAAMVVPGLHGRPPALHRWRLPARQRGPPAGQLARGVHRPAQGVRHRAAARRVDPGRQLGPRALAGRPVAAARVDRFGHAPQSGVREPARRAHGAGQQRRAPRGRDLARDQGHPRRRHRARSRAPASPPACSRTWRWVRWSARCPRPPTPQRDAALRRALAYAASKGVTAFAPHERGAGRPRHLPAGQGGRRAHRPRRALLPAGDLARGGGHHRASSAAATTGCGSAASKATWTAPSARPPRCSTRPTTTIPTTSGPADDPRRLAPRLDRRRGLGRSPGGGPRHR